MRARVLRAGGRTGPRRGAAGASGRRGRGAVQRPALGVVAAQALRAAPDGVLAGEVAPHGDAQPRAAAPAGLLGQLQGAALEAHDIVPADEALVVLGEELIEVHGRAERDEGTGGIGRRAGELGVVVGDEVLAQVRVGRLERGDPGHAELVDEAALEGAVEALDAAAGLGRVARDVVDAEAGEDRGRPR